ncbi:hypothetical protein cypCar_00045322 [Cyprinus carpio]|nr:hypothetical protein cypCar_00045322 [Cyprinus carpio]
MNTSSFYSTFGRFFPNNFSLWEHLQKNWTTRDLTPFSIDFLFAGHEPDTIVLMVMYVISFVTGLVGNIMALWVLTRRRNRLSGASATRRLLVNLAVCDMMVVCVCMPVNLGHQVYNAWVFGDFLCRAVPFVQAVSVSASVLSLAVISLNRYYSVHSPLHARSFFTASRMICMIAVVWVVSSALCLPLFFMNTTKTLSLLDGLHTVTVCVESWSKVKLRQGYNFLLFCALYGFPVVFNLIICFLTGWKLSRGGTASVSDPNQLALTSSTSRLKTRKRIAKMVFALVLLFTFSWLPLYAVDIWIDSNIPSSPDRNDELSNVEHHWLLQSRPFAQWLGLTNSSLNPLCYCFVGNLYRSAKRFRESYREKMSSVLSLTNKSSMRNSASKIQPRNSGSSRRFASERRSYTVFKLTRRCVAESMRTLPHVEQFDVVRPKRQSIRKVQSDKSPKSHETYPDRLTYKLFFGGKDHLIHLEKNRQLIGHNYSEIYYQDDGLIVSRNPILKDNCYYHGHIQDLEDSSVSVGICSGISGIDFLGDTVGLANKFAMCAESSAGVNQDHNQNSLGLASTIAHEMGHNMGMSHDEDHCKCGSYNSICIMTERVG